MHNAILTKVINPGFSGGEGGRGRREKEDNLHCYEILCISYSLLANTFVHFWLKGAESVPFPPLPHYVRLIIFTLLSQKLLTTCWQ